MNDVATIRGSPSEAATKFVESLKALGTSDLALLRRATTQPLGQDAEVFDLFTNLYRPLRRRFLITRWASYYVATLYPWHPYDRNLPSLAYSLSLIRPPASEKEARARADKRFRVLISSASLDVLRFALFLSVRRLSQNTPAVPVNWSLLLDDLSNWFNRERKVQNRWVKDYFRT